MNNLKNLDIATSQFSQMKAAASSLVLSLLDSTDHLEPLPGLIRQINDIDISDDATEKRFHDLLEQLYSQSLDAHNATTHLAPGLIDLSAREDALKFYEMVRGTVLDVLLITGPDAASSDVHELLSETQEFLISYDEAPIRQIEIHAAKIDRLAKRIRA